MYSRQPAPQNPTRPKGVERAASARFRSPFGVVESALVDIETFAR